MPALVDRTHGRWPWLAAAAVVPATAVCVARRDELRRDLGWVFWGSLPALLWHQTEEWVVPGGFMPWFNRDLLGSTEDERPLSRRVGFVVNVGAGWGVSTVVGLRRFRSSWLAAALLATHVGNAGLHLSAACRDRRYNPGTATAALLLAPLGVGGLAALARRPEVPRRRLREGIALGAAAGIGLSRGLRRRARRRRDDEERVAGIEPA